MKKGVFFGTDGIRGRVGQHPFTPDALRALGAAVAHWSIGRFGKKKPKILLGYDSRISGPEIKYDLTQAFAYFGLEVVDANILTTPAIYRLISLDATFDLGVAISASHNPWCDNGIKLFDAKRCKLDRDDEIKIERLFDLYFKNHSMLNFITDSVETRWDEAKKVYQAHVRSHFEANLLNGLKIVLDCANGAASKIAPEIFKSLGAEVVEVGTDPDGRNINKKCGSMHPELVRSKTLQVGADLGIAFDGDADRLVIINKSGRIKDGDDILMLLLAHPEYCGVLSIVSTIAANQGLEIELVKRGKSLIRTQVGDKYVSAALEERNLVLGGESSGHVIIKNYMPTGDGIFVALKVLESIIFNKNWDLETFEKYPQVLINIPVKNRLELSEEPCLGIIQKCRESIKDGRIIVRYSGTENILRIITEASTYSVADSVATNLSKSLRALLYE